MIKVKNSEGFAKVSYEGPSPSFLKEVDGFPPQVCAGHPSKVTASITFRKDNKYIIYNYEAINISIETFCNSYYESRIFFEFLNCIKQNKDLANILDLKLCSIEFMGI